MEKRKIVLMGVVVTAVTALLLPVMINAGSLEPSGSPAPTMKTLDQIPPTWSQMIPESERFVDVFRGTAVLDKETGLVWAKRPFLFNRTGAPWEVSWYYAIQLCASYTPISNPSREGWHLPSLAEFYTLMTPWFPQGIFNDSEFLNRRFWLSDDTQNPGYARTILFQQSGSEISTSGGEAVRTDVSNFFCVRGGTGRLSFH